MIVTQRIEVSKILYKWHTKSENIAKFLMFWMKMNEKTEKIDLSPYSIFEKNMRGYISIRRDYTCNFENMYLFHFNKNII